MKHCASRVSVGKKFNIKSIVNIHTIINIITYYTVCPEKSVTLTISENLPKPRNKLWMLCSDARENLHKTHMCLGQLD